MRIKIKYTWENKIANIIVWGAVREQGERIPDKGSGREREEKIIRKEECKWNRERREWKEEKKKRATD